MGAERYRHIRGSVSAINYHFVWCPKYRRTVLTGAVAERLKERLHEKAAELHCTITALEVMPDHLHHAHDVADLALAWSHRHARSAPAETPGAPGTADRVATGLQRWQLLDD
jgi:REP element-mobilizing transposase RayT